MTEMRLCREGMLVAGTNGVHQGIEPFDGTTKHLHDYPAFASHHGWSQWPVWFCRLGSARLGSARLGTACTGHRASALGGADPSNPEGHQDAGFSTIDSKRIAPVTLSRRRKRKGWSMTIGSVLTGVAVAMTPIPVAAAAVVPFGVT